MRARILRLAVLVSVLALAVFAVPLAVGAARYYVSDERTDLEDDTESAAATISATLPRGRLPGSVDQISAETDSAVYSLDGRRVSGVGPDRLDTDLLAALAGRERRGTAGDQVTSAVPLITDDRRVGVLRGARSTSGVMERTALTWLGMLGLASAALLATLLLARRLAARMAVPVEELAHDAKRLGDGNFTLHGRPSGIAEIDELRTALRTTADRLADLVARERAFSAEASHQLRTPLAGLRLQLEDAVSRPPDRTGPGLEDALETADRLHRTVEDLLRLARDARAPATPIEVATVAREVVDGRRGLGAVLDRAGRTVAVVADEPAVVAAVSEAALRQILEVLLDNAVTHGRGAVTVTLRRADAAVAVEVADEGETTHGEPELFARRSAASATGGGHGIGLALARRLAEAEGGRLRLHCAAPTTFLLLLLPGRSPADGAGAGAGAGEDGTPAGAGAGAPR